MAWLLAFIFSRIKPVDYKPDLGQFFEIDVCVFYGRPGERLGVSFEMYKSVTDPHRSGAGYL